MSIFDEDIDWKTLLVESNPTFPETSETWNDVDLAKRKQLEEELAKANYERSRKQSKKGMYQQILFSPLILAYNYPLITVGVLALGGYFAYKKFIK